MKLHAKNSLDAEAQRGCGNPNCERHHSPLDGGWFHPVCHTSFGLRLEYRQPDILCISCGSCGKEVRHVQTAVHPLGKIRQTCEHAKKRLLWVKYERGWLTVICRQCRAFVEKIAVFDDSNEAGTNAHDDGATESTDLGR